MAGFAWNTPEFQRQLRRGLRNKRAVSSLQGLAVGDAFGEQFFADAETVEGWLSSRTLPPEPWSYTDDTVMAMSVAETLREADRIDQSLLADRFVKKFEADPMRGYAGAAEHILVEILLGKSWKEAAPAVFDGEGSMGNGAAMRVAPLGAYYAHDFEAAAREAQASAEVTHAHPEGQAGAIAVAVATAWAVSKYELREYHRVEWMVADLEESSQRSPARASALRSEDFFSVVLDLVPPGETRTGLELARSLDSSVDVETAVSRLGNGSRVLAQDTVPFALWCARRHLDDFAEALWTTVSGLGDRDTTCAIVGGILGARFVGRGIPKEWKARTEPLSNMTRVADPLICGTELP